MDLYLIDNRLPVQPGFQNQSDEGIWVEKGLIGQAPDFGYNSSSILRQAQDD